MTKTIYAITGGAGFIGSHLADHLLQQGHTVRVVDNLLTGKQEHVSYLQSLQGDLEFFEMSINAGQLHRVFEGVDTVFHQAALPSVPRSVDNPMETHENCATGTLNVLIAAREAGVRRVVYAASSSVYGELPGDFKEETMSPAPISPYGVAKLAGEYYCRVFNHVYALETVCLRYFNVFGARQDPNSQYAAVIPKFITMLLRGEAPTIYGDGTQSRDFTYIENVIHGNMLASQTKNGLGEVMNLAMGQRTNLLELVDKLNNILGTTVQPTFLPARSGDIQHSMASIEKAGELLGYEPVVSVDEGLRRTAEWYMNTSEK